MSSWRLFIGAVFIALGALFLYLSVMGLKMGQTVRFSQSHYKTVTRRSDPIEFWRSEVTLCVNSLLLPAGIFILIKEFKRH